MKTEITPARVAATFDPVLDTIQTEIETWEQHACMEDSPLGGNVVKAAHYHGTAAGLRMAKAILMEHLSSESSSLER